MALLDSILGGSSRGGLAPGGPRGMSPLTLALLGTLAYRTLKGKGRLADMLGLDPPAPNPPAPNPPAQPGAPAAHDNSARDNPLSAAAISDGLNNLLNRFRQNGHAAEAESWISTGANSRMSPRDLEEALGEERISWLEAQTGLARAELLAGLSSTLPDAVDKLTPEGRLPSEHEVRRLM